MWSVRLKECSFAFDAKAGVCVTPNYNFRVVVAEKVKWSSQ